MSNKYLEMNDLLNNIDNEQKFVKYINNQKSKQQIYNLKSYIPRLWEYYLSGNSIISDKYFDIITQHIKKFDNNFDETIRHIEYKNKEKLPLYLGSINKIHKKINQKSSYINNELNKFSKIYNSTHFILTEKLDGVSCLIYFDRKNKNINLYTKGDSLYGTNISYIKHIIFNNDIKSKLNNILKSQQFTQIIAIRGELIIKKQIFSVENKICKIQNKKLYKDTRSMIVGLINNKKISQDKLRLKKNIDFIAYELIKSTHKQLTKQEQLNFFIHHKFNIPKFKLIEKNYLTEININNDYYSFKNNSEYDIDGIILEHNIDYVRDNKKNPNYLKAFKIQDNTYESIITNIKWKLGKYNKLTPVIIFNPVQINNRIITKASGHNIKFLMDKSIYINSHINILLSGDIIPYIVSTKKNTKNIEKDFNIPPNSIIKDGNLYIQLKNISNDYIFKQLNVDISRFFSYIKIKFWGLQTTSKILNHLINNSKFFIEIKNKINKLSEHTQQYFIEYSKIKINIIIQLLNIQLKEHIKDSINNIKGFSTKITNKLITSLYKIKGTLNIPELLGSLNIFGQGISIKLLTNIYNQDKKFLEKSKQELLKIKGISEITINKILKNKILAQFCIFSFKKYFTKTSNLNKDCKSKHKEISHKRYLKNYIFSSTGKLKNFTRSKLEKYIKDNGGTFNNSLSKNTDYLIIDNSLVNKNSSKYLKAIKLGIKIISICNIKTINQKNIINKSIEISNK